MTNIQPNYCSFEQCKLLKEKGFDVVIETWYDKEGDNAYVDGIEPATSYKFHLVGEVYTPQQWEVVEWLRIVHSIWVCVDLHVSTPLHYYYRVDDIIKNDYLTHSEDNNLYFNTPQEAYSAAFDYTLKELI